MKYQCRSIYVSNETSFLFELVLLAPTPQDCPAGKNHLVDGLHAPLEIVSKLDVIYQRDETVNGRIEYWASAEIREQPPASNPKTKQKIIWRLIQQ